MTRHHDTADGNLHLSVRGGRVQDDVANNMCMDGRLFHFPFLRLCLVFILPIINYDTTIWYYIIIYNYKERERV